MMGSFNLKVTLVDSAGVDLYKVIQRQFTKTRPHSPFLQNSFHAFIVVYLVQPPNMAPDENEKIKAKLKRNRDKISNPANHSLVLMNSIT